MAVTAVTGALLLPAHATPPGTPDSTDHRASPAGGGTRTEPSVAVNPLNPKVIVTATRDYGTQGIAAYYSADGGQHWSASALPVLGGADYGGDANLAFDGGGRVFAAYISYTSPSADDVGGLTIDRSLDGGRHWDPNASLAKHNRISAQGCTFADYPAIAADTRSGHGVIYVAWQDFAYTDDSCSTFRSVTLMLVKSTDHGRTWSRPRPIGGTAGGVFPRMTVGPDGDLYVSYVYEPSSLSTSEELGCAASTWAFIARVARSSDGGQRFHVSDAQEACEPSSALWVGDPVLGARLSSYTGATYRIPGGINSAVDPRTGVLVNVMGGQAPDTTQTITTAYSTDHGRSWHSGGTISGLPGENQQFPWVTAGPNGHLAIVYIGQLPGGFYVAEHTTSTDDGRTWSAATRLSSVPSHVHSAYLVNFIGDYIGDAIGSDGLAHPVWTDLREVAVNQAALDPYMGAPFDGGTIYTRSVRS